MVVLEICFFIVIDIEIAIAIAITIEIHTFLLITYQLKTVFCP
jgi:hypothetical protein